LAPSGTSSLPPRRVSRGWKPHAASTPISLSATLQLPDMDGYEVARWLKSDPGLRTVPLVAVTTLAMVGDRDRVLAAGFDGYLAKPINPETFVRQMEVVLRPGASIPPLPRPPE